MQASSEKTKTVRYPAVKIGPLRWMVLRIRDFSIWIRHYFYRRFYKMDLHPSCRFSMKANLDRTNPRGVHVGRDTYIAFGVVVLAHDMSRQFHTDTFIGERCFIGGHAIIMPGVRIGDECVIGAGSVVTQNIPSHSIAAGNPAKILRSNISTMPMGKIISKPVVA